MLFGADTVGHSKTFSKGQFSLDSSRLMTERDFHMRFPKQPARLHLSVILIIGWSIELMSPSSIFLIQANLRLHFNWFPARLSDFPGVEPFNFSSFSFINSGRFGRTFCKLLPFKYRPLYFFLECWTKSGVAFNLLLLKDNRVRPCL